LRLSDFFSVSNRKACDDLGIVGSSVVGGAYEGDEDGNRVDHYAIFFGVLLMESLPQSFEALDGILP